MLKFSLNKDHLNVNERFLDTTEKDMMPDDLENAATDLLAQVANASDASGVNDILDTVIAATMGDE